MGYGLPQPHARPDEDKIVGPALAIARDGDPHPRQFTYPSLPTYLDTLVVLAARAAGRLDLDGSLRDYVEALRLCRGLGVAFGVATIAATFALALRAHGSRAVALLAALIAATNFLHVLYSRFATVDTATTLFVTLTLLFAVRAGQGHRLRDYLWAGACCGLTASCKYNLGLVGLGLAAVAILRSPGGPAPPLRQRLVRLSLAGVAAVVAFALTSPYCVLRFDAVVRALRATSEILYAGPELALFVHLRETFPAGFGWPVFLAAAAGIVRGLRLRRPADLALLGFVLPVLLNVATLRTVFPRYLVSLVPPLAVMAAELVLVALPVGRLVALASAVAMVLPSLAHAVAFDGIAARPDTRVLAAAWIEARVPPRAGVITCKGYGSPVLTGVRNEETYCGMKRVEAGFPGYRYLVTQQHPAFTLTGVRPGVLAYLRKRGTPVAEFSPFRPGASDVPYFYSADAFFMPFSGFGAVERGGPILEVWDLDRIRNLAPPASSPAPEG